MLISFFLGTFLFKALMGLVERRAYGPPVRACAFAEGALYRYVNNYFFVVTARGAVCADCRAAGALGLFSRVLSYVVSRQRYAVAFED